MLNLGGVLDVLADFFKNKILILSLCCFESWFIEANNMNKAQKAAIMYASLRLVPVIISQTIIMNYSIKIRKYLKT